MIIKGATPTLVFHYDLPWSDTDLLYVTFAQIGKKVLELPKNRFTYEEHRLIARLTQQETLALTYGALSVQIKAKMKDGTICHSNIVKTDILHALNLDVI